MAYKCEGGNCHYTDAWNSWGRWLFCGLFIATVIVVFIFAFWAMSYRRIKNNEAPIAGTGWMFRNPYRNQTPLYPKVPLKDVYPATDPFIFTKTPSLLSSPERPSPSSSRSKLSSSSHSDSEYTSSLPSELLRNPSTIPEDDEPNTDLPLPTKTRYR